MTIKPENKSTQSVVEIEEGSGSPPNTPEASVLAKTSIKASIRIPSLAIFTYALVLAPVFSQILCPLPIYTRDEPRTVPLKTTNTLDDSLMTAQVIFLFSITLPPSLEVYSGIRNRGERSI